MQPSPNSKTIDISFPVLTTYANGSYRIESECVINGKSESLYFKVWGAPVLHRIEPFLCTLLAPAQKLGLDLHVHGPVSPKLLASLEILQRQFVEWWPEEFKIVNIHVDAELPMDAPAEVDRGGCCCFSMGVDAFYATLNHLDELKYLVYAHGFDTELDATDLRARISEKAQAAAAELGKRLIEVETNSRLITDPIVWWGYQGGGFLGALAMCISPCADRLRIPQHWSEAQAHPWSIHPAIDPLWSTETISVCSDDQISRIEKTGYLTHSALALRYLRVCWNGRTAGYNCGTCPKCVRTQLGLRVFRADIPADLFLRRVSLRRIAFKAELSDEDAMWFREVLEALRAQPYKDEPLERALVSALEQRYDSGLWKVVRRTIWKARGLVKRVLGGKPAGPSYRY